MNENKVTDNGIKKNDIDKKSKKKNDKEERLKQSLRNNLKLRKKQARLRSNKNTSIK